jgi:CBS domain containing-hemolysin-like protein
MDLLRRADCAGRKATCPATGRTAANLSSDSPRTLTLSFEQVSLSTMALLRGLFWLVLFIVLAFCFVVLFEYGPRDFANGSRKEFARLKSFVVKQTEKIQKPKK